MSPNLATAYRALVRCRLPCRIAQNLSTRVCALASRLGDETEQGIRTAAHEIVARHSGWIVFVLDPCTISARKDFPAVRWHPNEREAQRYVRKAARFGLGSHVQYNPKRRAWTEHDPSRIPPKHAFVDCGKDLRDPLHRGVSQIDPTLPDGSPDE